MNRFLLLIGIPMVFVAGSSLFLPNQSVQRNTVFNTTLFPLSVNGKTLSVAIADTPQLRQTGLSGVPYLQKDTGLFFVFPESGTYGMWMKDMHFSIDIVWLDSAFRVVDIHKGVSPETYPETFYTDTPARYALEAEAGFVEEFGVEEGQLFIWNR